MSTKIRGFTIWQLMALIACAIVYLSTNASAGAAENPLPSDLEKGNNYYLSVYKDGQPPYLHPDSPIEFNHTSILNKVTVKSNSSVNFPWPREDMRSFKDYYVNASNLWPRLSIIVNSGRLPNKVLRFEIWFDFDGQAKIESDVEAKAKFDDYTTRSSNSTELIDMKAMSITGTLKDFKLGTVKLVVWRLDKIDDDMFIYCGAFNKTSWIVIPYQFDPYVSPENNGTDGKYNVYIAIGLLAIGLVVLIAIVVMYHRNKSTPSGNENDDDDEEEDPREQKRRKRSEKRRKTSAFYRKRH